jgi:signal transduction histidine kinase
MLDLAPPSVLLRIEDDGVGFDAAAGLQKKGSLGLKGIQRRINALKGTLLIESEPGRGSVITVEANAEKVMS